MSPSPKITFFGTHDFAVVILRGLVESKQVEVIQVVTQPNEPVGRKQILTPPPIKLLADSLGLPVVQPASLKSYSVPSETTLCVVAEFGRILPESIINAPAFGTLNVHTSLLPKYRGASPIQTALTNGESTTGITIMKMDKGLDTGAILLQKELLVEAHDRYPEVNMKLADLGVSLLLQTIPLYLSGEITPQPQAEAQATLTRILSREDGQIHWHRTADEISNQYRGLYPWPGIWTILEGKRWKLLEIAKFEGTATGQPGQILVQNKKLLVICGNGLIEIKTLQLEGKNPTDAATFLLGYGKLVAGKIFALS